jgi:Ca2+-binding EF-hand superfamily protein
MSSTLSPRTQRQSPAKTSLLGRVETVTGKQNPIHALLHFANDVHLVEQYKTRQRLQWSKAEDKLPSSPLASSRVSLPRVPSVNIFDKFASPKSGSAKKPLTPHAASSSLPTTPRMAVAPTSGGTSARARSYAAADSVCPPLVQSQNQSPQHSRKTMESVRAYDMTRAPSQKSLTTARLADAHVRAGLFIIPTPNEDGPSSSKAASAIVNGHLIEGTGYLADDSQGDAIDIKMPDDIQMINDHSTDKFGGTNRDSTLSSSSTFSTASSFSTRSSFSFSGINLPRRSFMFSKTKEERAVQHLQGIVEESRASDHKGQETRQQLQYQHSQQISLIQELTKTMQQFQPQESQEIHDSLAALRLMMQGGAPAAVPKPIHQLIQGDDHGERNASKASKASVSAGESEDFSDMSLPALCGSPRNWNTEMYHRQAKVPACTLAKSCSRKRKDADKDRETEESSSSDGESYSESSDDSNISETFESSPSKRNSLKSVDPLKDMWKRNISLVRLVNRVGIQPVDHKEQYDEEVEKALGDLGFTRDDMLNLSTEHNLPFEKVVRARKLFLRYDKDLSGVIGPEDVQTVLRSMIKHLHPNASTIPPSLQTSPSTWEPAKFTEVVSFLSRTSVDEASLIPKEQKVTRTLAKEWGVDADDVERAAAIFASVGVDMSGCLDFPKFKQALPKILVLPEAIELPATKVNLYWNEVDKSRTGKIYFEPFFWWYQSVEPYSTPRTPSKSLTAYGLEAASPRSQAASLMGLVSRSISGKL